MKKYGEIKNLPFKELKGISQKTFGGSGDLKLSEAESLVSLQVNIPCPGHAPLITGELQKINGVESIRFRFPNLFDVSYNPKKNRSGRDTSFRDFQPI